MSSIYKRFAKRSLTTPDTIEPRGNQHLEGRMAVDIARLVRSEWAELQVSESVLTRLGLYVSGIEVTQAVQYYESDDHLTDPADRGANNAIRLIAGKPAWVRVYVESWFGASGVSGTLEVRRRHDGFLWSSVTTLNPDPSSMTSVPALHTTSYAATRGSLSRTLNFVIPAAEMIGTLRLIARVTAGSRSAEATADVGVTLRQTLRLAGVMISYNGPASNAPNAPNLTIAAPTLADLQAMSATALTLFPVQSTASFRTAGTLALTNHLQDTSFPTSGCGAGWDALHGAVANARTADGNQAGWIYYGLLPTGVPMGPVGGCGGGGVAVGPINQPGTLAHEAGHACDLKHAPAGGAPNPDPSYPAYEPYDPAGTPQASIGEYGLNVNNGNIASPQTFRDFMAYGGPSWISPYHYGLLLNNARLNPTTVGVDYPWWKDLVWEEIRNWPRIPLPDPPPFDLELPVFPPQLQQNVISLIVKVERGKVIDVLHVARARVHTELAGASETPLTAYLKDEEGSILAEGAVLRMSTAPGGCHDCGGSKSNTYIAQVFLPDVAVGGSLEIADGEEVVWRREAPAEPPRVEAAGAKVGAKGDVALSWEASAGVTEFWIRWSRDGESWQSIATDLREQEFVVDAGRLPPGDGLLQVVAHDGFYSSYSEPVRVTVPDRSPDVFILHPVEGHTYTAGQTLRLWGSTSDGEEVKPEDAVWLVDRKEVARGLDGWVPLDAGKRTITLRYGEGSASVTVTVVENGKGPG